VEALPVDGTHGDAVDAVGVAVKVAVIVLGGSVTTSEYVDGAEPAATVLDGVQHGPPDNDAGGVHALAVVGGAPRARVNQVVLKVVVHGDRLVGVRYRLTKDSQTSDLGVVGHTDAAHVVLDGGDLSGTAGAVAIVGQPRLGLVDLVVEVVRAGGVVVRLEVVAVHVEAVVDYGDGGVLASDSLQPHVRDVDVVPDLDGVEQVPLLVEDGIADFELRGHLCLLLDRPRDGCVSVPGARERPQRRRWNPLLPRLAQLLLL